MVQRWFFRGKRNKQYSVMLVEDDVPIAQVIQELLQDDGYAAHVAHTAEEALKLLESIPLPSVFVVDYMLPDMNGRQFIESIRVRFGHNQLSPVLMLTASKEGESIANELQITDYLPKPFDNVVLLDHIAKLAKRTK